jgi:hypothetical protein
MGASENHVQGVGERFGRRMGPLSGHGRNRGRKCLSAGEQRADLLKKFEDRRTLIGETFPTPVNQSLKHQNCRA